MTDAFFSELGDVKDRGSDKADKGNESLGSFNANGKKIYKMDTTDSKVSYWLQMYTLTERGPRGALHTDARSGSGSP